MKPRHLAGLALLASQSALVLHADTKIAALVEDRLEAMAAQQADKTTQGNDRHILAAVAALDHPTAAKLNLPIMARRMHASNFIANSTSL